MILKWISKVVMKILPNTVAKVSTNTLVGCFVYTFVPSSSQIS